MFRAVVLVLTVLSAMPLAGCGDKGVTAADTVTVTITATEQSVDESGATTASDTQSGVASADPTASSVDEVVVTASGFTSRHGYDYLGGAGIVLTNHSDKDAVGVQVTVDAIDDGGTIVGSDLSRVNVIPAGESYYLDADPMPEKGVVKDLEIAVDVQSFDAPQYRLPPVTGVRLAESDIGGFTVDGTVENPYSQALSTLARISCVLWDGDKIVGGAFTFPETELKPARKMMFHAYVDSVPSATRAKCSMDDVAA